MDSPQVSRIAFVISALTVSTLLYKVGKVLWMYTRPSRLERYLHTSSAGRPAWALVTGASDGIGLEFAAQLAGRGFNVVLHGRNEAKLQGVRARLAAAHPAREFRVLVADSAQTHELQGQARLAALVAELADLHLTVVVDNVGGPVATGLGGGMDALLSIFWERTPLDIVKEISLNCVWNALLLNALLPTLIRNSPSLVIDIGSLADTGSPLLTSYGGSKAFKRTCTTALAREMLLTGKDVDFVHMRVGMTTDTAIVNVPRSLFVPGKDVLVRSALARIGGKSVVTPYFPHALQDWAANLLPSFLMDSILVKMVRQMKETAAHAQDKKK